MSSLLDLTWYHFGTICAIKKSEKRPWKSVTFREVAGFSLQLY